uniref:Uncharacterized protein n=1 Tax=Clytia hemisphaerica TaxID=252671 RepID=A0A7M5WX82_9CNID|eukprot:TCONS_00061621-protein
MTADSNHQDVAILHLEGVSNSQSGATPASTTDIQPSSNIQATATRTIAVFKPPFHTKLVNQKSLRVKVYSILFLIALIVIMTGVFLGVTTKEYFIITAMVPIGVLIIVANCFCIYGYEFYLNEINERMLCRLWRPKKVPLYRVAVINGGQGRGDQPPKYEDIMLEYDDGYEIACAMLEQPPRYEEVYEISPI